MPNPNLAIQQIQDQYIRKNFEELDKYFRAQSQLMDFNFFELVFTASQTGFKKAHGLSYIPLDVIVTRVTGTGQVTFKYASFDETNMQMDVSGPCRIRFFVGTYFNFTSNVQTASSDAQKFSSGV